MTGKPFFTLDDFAWGGKRALVRVDVNCPVDEKTKAIAESDRIAAHAATLKELAEKNAKVIVLAHQGRKGGADFLSLDQHAKLLAKHAGRAVAFVPDVIGAQAVDAVRALKDGEILLLDNVRLLDEETVEKTPLEHAKGALVRTLGPLADVFVGDAYSAAHRAHASIVGFAAAMPACAGRVMEREVEGNARVLENPERPLVYVLGGAKPDDVVKLLKAAARNPAVDAVLTGGVVGQLVALAREGASESMRAWLEKQGFLKNLAAVKEAVEESRGRILAPVDVAYEADGQRWEASADQVPAGKLVSDVGSKTIELYSAILRDAKTVYVKGPVGVFENALFERGTRAVFDALVAGGAFSVVGGGHTLDALEKFGFSRDTISHVSLAGGALLTYLAGEPLPGVEVLKNAKKRGVDAPNAC